MVGNVRVVGVTPSRRRFARITLGAFRTFVAVLRERADVHHFHDPELIPVGLLLRALGKKVVYDVHETNWATIRHKHYLPRWIRPGLAWILRKVELASARYFSGIVAATPAISDQFGDIRTPRVVVQNFPQLDLIWKVSPLHSRPPLAIYAGGISEPRGLFAMVDAMDLLPRELGAKLLLVGTVSPQDLARVKQRPGWQHVEFIGQQPSSELPRLLSTARVGLVVLQPLPNYVESYPTKMFEYMAAGLPTIASDFPLWRRIVADNGCGLLVNPLNTVQIAATLERILTDDSLAETMSAKALSAVRSRYSWHSEEQKLTAFYRERFAHAERKAAAI
jgi:glycosyltransferase involved in cell wall biosynthesis